MLNEYIVLDLETTGLSKYKHKITEIAAIKFKDNEIVDKFHTLINPKVKIPSFITKLTGINYEMVKDAPTINEIMPELKEFLSDHTIIAHNSTFDHGFLNQNHLEHYNLPLPNQHLCTRKLAHRLLPELYSKRLSVICEHFEIINKQAHRAMTDVEVTAEIFSRFLEIMKNKKVTTKEDIVKFENSPRKKWIEYHKTKSTF